MMHRFYGKYELDSVDMLANAKRAAIFSYNLKETVRLNITKNSYLLELRSVMTLINLDYI
jgi:hypothetical protein